MALIVIAHRAGDAEDAKRRLSAALSARRHHCVSVELDNPLTESFLEGVSHEAILLVLIGPRWSASGSLSLSKKALDVAEARRIRVIALFNDLDQLPPEDDLPPVLQPRPAGRVSFRFTRATWDGELTSLINVIEHPTKAALLDKVLLRGAEIQGIQLEFSKMEDFNPEEIVAQVEPLAKLHHLRRALQVLLNMATLVRCSVFAPSLVQAGDSILVQVLAHLPEDAEEALKVARAYDTTAGLKGAALLETEVVRGTTLTFALNVPGATVDDSVQRLVWRGSPASVQFGVAVPPDRSPRNLIGTVTVSDGTVPIGSVKFLLQVMGRTATATNHKEQLRQSWLRYRTAFISYASQDRAEVLKRVQMLERTGIDYFQDLLSLDPGERWKKTIYEKIDDSDVFFLFWSANAKESEWVIKEAQRAMDRHKVDEFARPEIIPVLIEGPPPVPPPPELKDLHFNDRLLYFIAGSASQS